MFFKMVKNLHSARQVVPFSVREVWDFVFECQKPSRADPSGNEDANDK
jgi:hypothetical protein